MTPSYDTGGGFNDVTGIGVCHVTAVIRERSQSRGYTVCAGEQRIKHVFNSQTNEVDVRILGGQSSEAEAQYFLLEFQGKWRNNEYMYLVNNCSDCYPDLTICIHTAGRSN